MIAIPPMNHGHVRLSRPRRDGGNERGKSVLLEVDLVTAPPSGAGYLVFTVVDEPARPQLLQAVLHVTTAHRRRCSRPDLGDRQPPVVERAQDVGLLAKLRRRVGSYDHAVSLGRHVPQS